jgi:hypothetical protein
MFPNAMDQGPACAVARSLRPLVHYSHRARGTSLLLISSILHFTHSVPKDRFSRLSRVIP